MEIWNEINETGLHFRRDAEKKHKIVQKMKEKHIIIYGYGVIGNGLEKVCDKLGWKVDAVCDKNKLGLPCKEGIIETLEDAVIRLKNAVVAVCVRGEYEQVKEQYKHLIPEEDFIDGDDFYHYTPSYFVLEENNPFTEKMKNYQKLCNERNAELQYVMEQLADQKSVDTLKNYFKYLITYNLEYLEEIYDSCQYFPSDIIHLNDKEVLLDCGAYDGDTIVEFLNKSENRCEKIHCFEPGAEAYKNLLTRIEDMGIKDKVNTYQIGVFDKKGTVYFEEDRTGSKITDLGTGTVSIDTDCIDNMGIKNATFIKMDIEGSELAALKGAEQTIKNCKPKLAICIYHKPDDIVDIPLFIMNLGLDYKYYIRQHCLEDREMVFYAI